MKIDEIIENMRNNINGFETGNGASPQEINTVENEFSVTLPEDYKYFLGKYGYITSDGPDILGICHEIEYEEYFSMPYYTSSDRSIVLPNDFNPRPQNTVIVGPYGGGGHFFLHCDNSKKPGKVELLLDELMGKADNVKWNSFTEFLSHYK